MFLHLLKLFIDLKNIFNKLKKSNKKVRRTAKHFTLSWIFWIYQSVFFYDSPWSAYLRIFFFQNFFKFRNLTLELRFDLFLLRWVFLKGTYSNLENIFLIKKIIWKILKTKVTWRLIIYLRGRYSFFKSHNFDIAFMAILRSFPYIIHLKNFLIFNILKL